MDSNDYLVPVIMFILGVICTFMGLFLIITEMLPTLNNVLREGLGVAFFLIAMWLFFDFAMNSMGRRDDDEQRQAKFRAGVRERVRDTRGRRRRRRSNR